MALPPKGDPRRPLHLAVRSTRMLAIAFLLLGLLGTVPLMMMSTFGHVLMTPIFLLGIVFIYLGPGVAYLVFSIYLKQRRFWAVVGALVLASLQLLLLVIATAAIVVAMLKDGQRDSFLVPAVIIGLFLVALVQLIRHLSLSFEAIRHAPIEQQPGFEPLMVQPISVSAPITAPDDPSIST